MGLRTRLHTDALTGALTVERSQDVTAILSANRALANDGDGYSPSRELRRVASIPLVVVEQWMAEGIDLFDPACRAAVRRRLNDPDWRWLRTAPGRL